ncbi:hypothetical protein CLV62_10475 [Dysgonomonas alginatilytica]|uniref:Uncharacterized protein n=1 Tax=Dysgonomonas alginatilytica TaxID=1605892 RepID=A0A2V3PU26_9BACT|nr:hypothetical protein [Dysgonomonas alginatilytica]PXV66815.1 hypothetical protein CLV62_10475 [Dysgonomonas alginatilytica]
MRRTLLLLIVIFFTIKSFTQTLPNLGDSKQEVKQSLANSHHKFIVSSSYPDKDTYSIGAANDYVVFIYYFKNSDTCTRIVIIPKHKDILLGLIEGYNESAIVLSPYEWIDYIKDKAISTKLLYDEDNNFQYLQIKYTK